MSTIAPLTAACLSAPSPIAHGFFTRQGGTSRGGYASLNCGLGSQDDPAAVRENRARVAAHLGARDIVTANQVHSAVAVVADGAWDRSGRPRADAIVTAAPGLAVAVLTADCAPILFSEPEAGVVAAAHAGWRGALGGVIESTLATIETLGGRRARIRAAVGPCIGQAAYEVGPEFEEAFLAENPANGRFFVRPAAAARPHFDLSAYVENRLHAAGVGRAERLAACTYAQGGDFFSYRRSRAGSEPDYGRQISAIVLT